MNITRRNSNFSQFSDDLWMIAEHEGTKIHFDIDQSDILEFVTMLVETAIDCLHKSKKDTDVANNLLYTAMDEIEKIKKESK